MRQLPYNTFILDAATNPALREADEESISKFVDQVNKELEGPQYAIRLLAHKIQSPIERESLYALLVIMQWLNFILFSIYSLCYTIHFIAILFIISVLFLIHIYLSQYAINFCLIYTEYTVLFYAC